jgi:hypothetical protein
MLSSGFNILEVERIYCHWEGMCLSCQRSCGRKEQEHLAKKHVQKSFLNHSKRGIITKMTHLHP